MVRFRDNWSVTLPPRNADRSERARSRMLEVASRHLAVYGYDELSVDRVAAEAGIGKQTMYELGPTKSVLVAECIRQGYVTMPTLMPHDTGDARADFAAWVEKMIAVRRDPATANLIRAYSAAAAEDAELAKEFAAGTSGIEHDLAARLQAGIDAGQVPPSGSAALIASMVFGALNHRLLARHDTDPEFIEHLMRVVFGTV